MEIEEVKFDVAVNTDGDKDITEDTTDIIPVVDVPVPARHIGRF